MEVHAIFMDALTLTTAVLKCFSLGQIIMSEKYILFTSEPPPNQAIWNGLGLFLWFLSMALLQSTQPWK